MRILNLSDNSLKEEGGSEVAKILKSVPHLEELILDDCLIRSRGCRALARYLEHEDIVPGLTRLSLYGNEIKREAAISLAFALGTKTKLTHLWLNANEFGSSGVDSLLQVNRKMLIIWVSVLSCQLIKYNFEPFSKPRIHIFIYLTIFALVLSLSLFESDHWIVNVTLFFHYKRFRLYFVFIVLKHPRIPMYTDLIDELFGLMLNLAGSRFVKTATCYQSCHALACGGGR